MFHADLEFRPQLKAKKIRDPSAKRIFRVRLPGPLGQLGYTRDPGTAEMFSRQFFRTKLTAHHFGADGRLIKTYDLGSGKVTNIGVLALANDYRWAQVSGAPVNTFGTAKYHAWGTGVTAEAKTDFELVTYAKPTAAAENAVVGTNSLNYEKSGKNQKLRSVATITNNTGGTLTITEWGLHTSEALKPANSTAVAVTATTLETTAAGFTASGATTRGEQNKIVVATEAAEALGLIYENTTKILTIPGWIKANAESEGTTPTATTKFRVEPVLWDRRKFEPIGAENLNKIEFIYELEFVAGG